MQRPYTTRSVLACALAISAAIPSFSQAQRASALTSEHRQDTRASSQADSAGVKLPNVDRPHAELGGRLPIEARSRVPSDVGTALAEPGPTRARQRATGSLEAAVAPASSPTDDAAITRDLAALRARLVSFLDARFATALVDAARASVAPSTVHRGQLLRASLAGNLRASYWLLLHPELLLGVDAVGAERPWPIVPSEQERALRIALYRRLTFQAGTSEELATFDVLGHVQGDLTSGWLDAAAAMRVQFELEFCFAESLLAREARLARAHLLAEHGRGIAHLEGHAARLFNSLLADPNTNIASAAANALWRLQHLRVGCQAPPLCGNDVVGNEHCLQDFRGRIVLVRFWSFDDAGSESVLQQDAFLDRQFWDHPFSVLGVNRDADRELYLQLNQQLGIPGIQVYEGPAGEAMLPEILERRAGRPMAFDAWREVRAGSSYLIDARGVIRAVDPPLARLPELIQGLVDESYLERRVLGY